MKKNLSVTDTSAPGRKIKAYLIFIVLQFIVLHRYAFFLIKKNSCDNWLLRRSVGAAESSICSDFGNWNISNIFIIIFITVICDQ